jgi:predicted neuraminidase
MTPLRVLALMLAAMQAPSPIVTTEFIYETAPFPSAHASTIVETPDGLVAAWFGGTRERAPDVGIWVSRKVNGAWSAPVEAANGVQPEGARLPLWNPVLFDTGDGALTLFYKEGPSPSEWWGMALSSRDNGRTWSDRRRLPDGVLGPIKNKPVRLADGTIVSGSSTETTSEPSVWRVHFERSEDRGKTWTIVRPPPVTGGREPDAIQPAILVHADGRLQAIGRTRSQRVFETWSSDRGRTWTPLALTSLPNPNAGIDAVTLRDGRHLVVYNHTTQGRSPLDVALSRDGKAWDAPIAIETEPGEYSYPAVIQTSDGLVHITYTWKRQRIKHVVIDPARISR